MRFIQAWQSMRIPSQFTEDSLYRRSGQRKNRIRNRNDSRRMVHMVIALALVLVMMQQASKPEIYEPFFGVLASESDLSNSDPTPKVLADLSAEPGPDAVSKRFAQIDSSVFANVVDGTVWRSGDFEALYWMLILAAENDETSGPTVGVLPLLQQPEVFRNKVVRVAGRVVRSERIQAPRNRHGIRGYWQLWIRPSQGVDRPFVVIARSVPVEVAAVGPEATDRNGPSVVVAGRFLKRLAYRSAQGADLAPVVVGKLINATPASTGVLADSQIQTKGIGQLQLLLLVGAVTLVGVSLAVLVMWRTSVLAARTRRIRSSVQKVSDPFLESLGNSS